MIADVALAVDCPADIVASLRELHIVDSAHFALVDIDTVLALADRRADHAARAHLQRVNSNQTNRFSLSLLLLLLLFLVVSSVAGTERAQREHSAALVAAC
jgi:hypothetical protein